MKKLIIIFAVLFLSVQCNVYSQNLWEKIKDKGREVINQGKEKVRDIYDNNKEKVKEKTKDIIRNTSDNIKNFNNKHRDTYDKIFDKTRQITSEIKKDPRKIIQYKKQADRLVQGAVIIGVKNIPVYDPQSGQMTNMDSYCRNFIREVGGDAIRGSELEEDPVGLAVMVMMDEDYLLEAKLITTPEGEWISANDALNSSLSQYSVNLLHTDYAEMKSAYDRGDAVYFNNKFEDFRRDIANLSNYCSYSCPWVYLFNGEKYIKYDEIIKDQNSEHLDKYQSLKISNNFIVNNTLSILINEELDETSYLDHIYLDIDGYKIYPANNNSVFVKLLNSDNDYLVLNKGECLTLYFEIPVPCLKINEVNFIVKGYYIPIKQIVINQH